MTRILKGNPDFTIGMLSVIFGLFLFFVWIPNDVETDVIEKVRFQTRIGDSLAPSIAAFIIFFSGIVLTVQSLFKDGHVEFSGGNVKYIFLLLSIMVVSINLMHWSGYLIVELLKNSGLMDEATSYRVLRDTAPWKYIGFVLGGAFFSFTLTCMMERAVRWKSFIISLLAIAVLIIIYDVPFDNILLPPNGDF